MGVLHYNKKTMKKITFCSLLVLLVSLALDAAIYKLKIEGPIETITEEYVLDAFKAIKKAGDADLIVIEMDTPGGFDTSMRSIIKEILAAPAPVAVYVSPRGARAASAGIFIAIAADIAAMAPGTNMGAAHPVSATGQKIEETMNKKVTNDAVAYARSLAKNRNRNEELAEMAVRESKSYTAEECLKNNLVEYMAGSLEDLFKQLEGREVTLVNGEKAALRLTGENVIPVEMSRRQKFLKTITNPNLAFFLLIFGLLGLYIEFTHPGTIIPGVLGGISLLLAFLAFQVLPINYVGLLLILLSIGFFIAEIKIQGFGILGIGGIVSFILGSVMLIDAPIPEMRPTMTFITFFALIFASILLFLSYKVFTAMNRETETGKEGMIGEIGIAKTLIGKEPGKVFVHGEWWNAVSDLDIPVGSKVQIEAIEDFVLRVKPFNHS